MVNESAMPLEDSSLPAVEPPAAIPVLNPELARWCHIFVAAVHERLELEPLKEVTRSPLSLAQFHLLRLVARRGLQQVSIAVRFLGVSAPAVTKSIDKLVRLGLIKRRTSAVDRRALVLQATARGRRLVRRHDELKAAQLNRALAALRAEETAEFGRLLKTVSLELLRQSSVAKGECLRCAGHVDDDCAVADLRGGCPYHEQVVDSALKAE